MNKLPGDARKIPAAKRHVARGAPRIHDKRLSKGEETRRSIIARAVRMVSEVGYEGLSIGTLAEEAQLSKSGLFAHFKSKEALQLGVMQEVINRYIERVVRPALARRRGVARLRVLFENKMQWIAGQQESRGCLLHKASLEYDNRSGHPVRERLVQALREWRELLARSVTAAIEEGELRDDLDATQFAYEFDGILMMYQQAHGLMRDRAAEERALTAFEALLERSSRAAQAR